MLGAYDLDLTELPKAVMAEYHWGAAGRPIPQIPYVETGNAGERGLTIFEPDETRRVAEG
jgi:hypothetical protein